MQVPFSFKNKSITFLKAIRQSLLNRFTHLSSWHRIRYVFFKRPSHGVLCNVYHSCFVEEIPGLPAAYLHDHYHSKSSVCLKGFWKKFLEMMNWGRFFFSGWIWVLHVLPVFFCVRIMLDWHKMGPHDRYKWSYGAPINGYTSGRKTILKCGGICHDPYFCKWHFFPVHFLGSHPFFWCVKKKHQVIQAVPFWSPNVGGHLTPFQRVTLKTHPKKGHVLNHQGPMGFWRRSRRVARPCNVLQGEEQLAPSKSVKLATLLPQAVPSRVCYPHVRVVEKLQPPPKIPGRIQVV